MNVPTNIALEPLSDTDADPGAEKAAASSTLGEFNSWFSQFCRQVAANEEQGIASHVTIDPYTIYLRGGLGALRSMVDFLERFSSVTVTKFVDSWLSHASFSFQERQLNPINLSARSYQC